MDLGPTLARTWESWAATIIGGIPQIIAALAVLLVAALINGRVQRTVEQIVGRRQGQRELARLLGLMTRIGLTIVTLLIVVAIFNLTQIVTAFVASLGIAGLLLAFALQDITKNFAAGVLLLLLRPFRLDDRIKVKDFEGVVTDITLRSTALLTDSGEQVLVPNADVYSNPIINYTRYPQRRHDITLKMPASIPPEHVRQQLETTLRALPVVERTPKPYVVLADPPAADQIAFTARFWLPSATSDVPQRTSAVRERLHSVIDDLAFQAQQIQSSNGA